MKTLLAKTIALGALKTLANNLWKSLWIAFIAAIESAERTFKTTGFAEQKKEFVIKEVLRFITNHRKLSNTQLWAVKFLLGKIIDQTIEVLNSKTGKDWIEKVTDLQKYWAGRIPLID